MDVCNVLDYENLYFLKIYLKVSIRYHGTTPPPINSATQVTVEKILTWAL